jgi:hypothetical protein
MAQTHSPWMTQDNIFILTARVKEAHASFSSSFGKMTLLPLKTLQNLKGEFNVVKD